jgi:OHCU decarboxylase
LDRGIEWLNTLSPQELKEQFLKCCGSTAWADRMSDARPFESREQLISEANRIWWSLEADDWLEAFRSHPKIGEKKAQSHISADAQKWSEEEQAAADQSSTATKQALAQLNEAYQQKFGFIYIICAAGKSSEEMLEILEGRMDNAPDEELRVAAAEQAKITQLRLKKLLEQ